MTFDTWTGPGHAIHNPDEVRRRVKREMDIIRGNRMETVEIDRLDYWGWECPKCKAWIETQDDPSYHDYVECDDCGERFKPVVTS